MLITDRIPPGDKNAKWLIGGRLSNAGRFNSSRRLAGRTQPLTPSGPAVCSYEKNSSASRHWFAQGPDVCAVNTIHCLQVEWPNVLLRPGAAAIAGLTDTAAIADQPADLIIDEINSLNIRLTSQPVWDVTFVITAQEGADATAVPLETKSDLTGAALGIPEMD